MVWDVNMSLCGNSCPLWIFSLIGFGRSTRLVNRMLMIELSYVSELTFMQMKLVIAFILALIMDVIFSHTC
jgi:hypothetical protein